MSTATTYDVTRLPAASPDVDFGLRAANGLPGFGPMWGKYMGGLHLASIAVLAAFENRPANIWRTREGTPGERVELRGNLVEALTTGPNAPLVLERAVVPSMADLKGRKLAVLAVLDCLEDGERVPHSLAKALVKALDIEPQIRHRARHSQAVRMRDALEDEWGMKATEAVQVASRLSGAAERTVRGYQPVEAPGSEAWFAAGVEEQVAAAIITRIEEHGPTLQLRWDVWELFEGFFRRRWAPSPPAIAALAHVLDLVGPDGCPRPVALAGVVHRRAFMLAADVAANTTTSPHSQAALNELGTEAGLSDHTIARWADHALRPLAVEATRCR